MDSRSTARLLLEKASNELLGQECVDWALHMMASGHDSPNLRVLAGAVKPYRQFELAEWRDLALEELGIKPLDLDSAVKMYACERLRDVVKGSNSDLVEALAELKDLGLKPGPLLYHPALFSFYLLYFAHEDIKVMVLPKIRTTC